MTLRGLPARGNTGTTREKRGVSERDVFFYLLPPPVLPQCTASMPELTTSPLQYLLL